MNDRIEHSGDSAATTSNGFGRREMLQRTGFVVGAAALWNTPIVKTIAASAAVPTGDRVEFCLEGASGGQPSDLVWRFQPRACVDSLNEQDVGAEDVTCSGGVPTGCPGDEFMVVIQRPGSDRIVFDDVSAGDTLGVIGDAGSNYRVGIYCAGTVLTGGGSSWKSLPSTESLLQDMTFHVSCSQPLALGDTFGSLELVGGEDQAGGGFVSNIGLTEVYEAVQTA